MRQITDCLKHLANFDFLGTRKMSLSKLSFSQFTDLMESKGVKTLYMKHLAENDNSKNQVYLGKGDFSLLQVLPNQGVYPDKNSKREYFKAKVDFYWLDEHKNINHAPHAQIILYPDYPELRFSGFLKDANNSPSNLMSGRLKDRVMFFGVCEDDKIIGYVTTENTPLVKEIADFNNLDHVGVFVHIPIRPHLNPEATLLKELKRIHGLGWIGSKRLSASGLLPCLGTNCGGLTLEAELGIVSNSRSEPDFMGYEVKQYNVRNFNRIYSGSAITLMTPEPQDGVYKNEGADVFVRRYGYLDGKISDRMNFSGIHFVNVRHSKTGLTLRVDGYGFEENKITDVNGSIKLVADDETVAAAWMFTDIIAHWSRKHNRAVYVPSNMRKEPNFEYSYGHIVLLAEKTSPLFLFKALVDNKVYYDPGIHLDNMSTSAPSTKRRSQFRIHPKDLGILYEKLFQKDVLVG